LFKLRVFIIVLSVSPEILHQLDFNASFGYNTVEMGQTGVGGCSFKPFVRGASLSDSKVDVYAISIGSSGQKYCGHQLIFV